jgi:hypothetical protein
VHQEHVLTDFAGRSRESIAAEALTVEEEAQRRRAEQEGLEREREEEAERGRLLEAAALEAEASSTPPTPYLVGLHPTSIRYVHFW